MTAPTADLRVCAWCGRAIALGSGVKYHPPTMAFNAAEWFCDWTCEGALHNRRHTTEPTPTEGPAVTTTTAGETHRQAFLRLLTEDGDTHDRRRKTYNQAIFAPEAEGGQAVWSSTDLEMVLDTYDRASKVTT